jgi:hypothetical protein
MDNIKEEVRPVRPPTNMNVRGSNPSPRKVNFSSPLATARLSKPLVRETNHRNSTIDEYGERKSCISSVELYYSELLDEISDQIYVPPFMRHKMIFAIIETEKPHVYHAMKNFHKHYMISSEARQARMRRQKADMCTPPTLQQQQPGKRSYFQEICIQDKIKAEEQFTEKLIKVLYKILLNMLLLYYKFLLS